MMTKFFQSPSGMFFLGALSSAPLFGVYMYFGPIIVVASPVYALYLFLNNGETSFKTIRKLLGFILGALCSWIAIYFLFVKH